MRTREEKIKLLSQVILGELPASALKRYTLTYLHQITPEQRKLIEAKVGVVAPANCSIYHPNEPLMGLWNGIPVGMTAIFHLSMFKHPESTVDIIKCSDDCVFSAFLKSLPQKPLISEEEYNTRRNTQSHPRQRS
jgi:hypothetical protein